MQSRILAFTVVLHSRNTRLFTVIAMIVESQPDPHPGTPVSSAGSATPLGDRPSPGVPSTAVRSRRQSVPLVAAGAILVLDAVICLLLAAVFLMATHWRLLLGGETSRSDLVLFYLMPLAVCAAVSLWGPAVATLVITVRRRWTRMAGGITAGLLIVFAAAQGAEWHSANLRTSVDVAGADVVHALITAGTGLLTVVVIVNLVAIALLIGPSDPTAPPAEPLAG